MSFRREAMFFCLSDYFCLWRMQLGAARIAGSAALPSNSYIRTKRSSDLSRYRPISCGHGIHLGLAGKFEPKVFAGELGKAHADAKRAEDGF
jgi:hypothetical protein